LPDAYDAQEISPLRVGYSKALVAASALYLTGRHFDHLINSISTISNNISQ
jgi:hypothetical protein